MFGTLFNQKKTDQPQELPAADATGQIPAAQPVDPTQQQATDTTSASVPSPTIAPTPDAPVVPGQDPVNPSAQQGAAGTPGTPNNPAVNTDMSALSHLDPRAAQVLTHAQEETRRLKQQFIEPDQILFGLLYDEQVYKFIGEFQVDSGVLSKEIQTREKMGTFQGQPTLSSVSQQVFDQAYRDAKMRGANFISPEDLLIVLFSPNFPTGAYLDGKGLKKEAVIEKLSKNPSLNYSKKTVLEKFGIDLTEEARAGKLDPVAGRDKEVDRIEHILLRRTKNNPIIIGETGVGKTAIVEGLAQKIVAGSVPKDLQDKRIFQLDVASLVAGASHRGEFEERLRGVINEVLSSNNKIILFIDEIHSLLGTGEGEGVSAANIIKPHLARGHFQLIGATTTIEYRKNFEKDKAFERRFQPVTAEEPSEESAFEMMKVLRPKYEKFHKVTISDDTLKECVKLSKKYIGERYLPDKAVDLLDEGASDVKLQHDEGKRSDVAVKKGDIERVVSGWTGIPITKLTEDESAKLLQLEDRIHKRLIGQEEAVVAVSEAVRRGRIGLAAANRPIASFIFLGPTGTGKTELAKTLAELLFGRDDAMVRLDMSEYMEKHEVAKLIGAPPGYVGYEEGGQLTEAVRKKPYSIVLLDEIEKAHPDVFNILLQLLEDGRLTDNKGNTISFKNTIVICTSNIGSGIIQQQLSKIDPKIEKTPEEFTKMFQELTSNVKTELIKFFRPELLNRFDDVVIFKPLKLEHMAGIARLGIAKTAGLLKEQGFILQISEKAIAQLAKDGYDPVYGARPLRRLIQTAIENPIALAIIGKKFAPGDTIVIDFNDAANEFSFTKGAVGAGSVDVKKIILQIVNPQDMPASSRKEEFIRFHDELMQKSKTGDPLATEILALTKDSTQEAVNKIMDDLKKAKEQEDSLAADILTAINSDIAQEVEMVHEKDPATKFKKILQQVINPLYLASEGNKDRFSKLYDKLSDANRQQNPLAASILAITDMTSDTDMQNIKAELEKAKAANDPLAIEILNTIEQGLKTEEVGKLRETIGLVVNPITAKTPLEKEKYSSLREKVMAISQKGNTLSSTMLSISDSTTDDQLIEFKKQLEDGVSKNDELALLMQSVLSMSPKDQAATQPAPSTDPAQTYPFGMGQQAPVTPPQTQQGVAETIPTDPNGAATQQAASTVDSAPPIPASVNPQFNIGSGMSALNEQIQREHVLSSTPFAADDQEIS